MRVEKISFKNGKGEKLSGLVYIPDGKGPFPAVVLIHGLTGGIHEIKNRYMCDMLMNNGFVALQFDFYDKPNNLSEPKIENTNVTQQVKTTKLAIDFVDSLPYVDKNKIGLTGHSLGGMTIVIYAASKDPRIKALVVQSAVSQFGTSKVIKQFGKEEIRKKGYIQLDKSWGNVHINYSFYEDGKKYDVYKEAEKIVCPTLVFHGDEDESVNFRQSEELIKHIKIKDKKLEIIKGADHCYYNKGTLQIATELMIDWFNKWLK
jgi:hypothetical protein